MQRTALFSVYHKKGIVEFAQGLVALGWNILASGGTAKALADAGIPVRDVAELVGGGAILGHRVVTLSREVHAGLLATESDADIKELEGLGIPQIDMVCVDLYPLAEAIAAADATTMSVIEKTDIGGPTMLSSAAKGRRIVICDPADRERVLTWLENGEPDRENFITALAAKADFVVANYRLLSARFHSNGRYTGMTGTRVLTCRYGENPQQADAALFSAGSADPLALDKFQVVAGAEPSYNNLGDLDRLLQTMTHLAAGLVTNCRPFTSIALGCKHGNMCGASFGSNDLEVLQHMLEGDLRAIFGGLVMVNFTIDEMEATVLLTHMAEKGRRILDGIIAPRFTDRAIEMLKRKGDKCRFIANPELAHQDVISVLDTVPRFRYVRGGFLEQLNYEFVLNFEDPRLERFGELSVDTMRSLLLAWAVGCTSTSNTMTIVKDGVLIGNGVGQQDRVGAAKLAIMRATDAGHGTKGAVAYSDSFFPFTDGVETLAEAGIKAILASSGSVNDEKVKEFCAKAGIGLFMIPDVVGRGFYGH